jgi:Zn-dependent membrane protease YugP
MNIYIILLLSVYILYTNAQVLKPLNYTYHRYNNTRSSNNRTAISLPDTVLSDDGLVEVNSSNYGPSNPVSSIFTVIIALASIITYTAVGMELLK